MKRSQIALIISSFSMVFTFLLFIHDYLYDTGENEDSIPTILIVGSIYFVLIFACLVFIYFIGSELAKLFRNKP